MLLPPLFPLFIREFDFSYAELGLLVTTFFVISGIGQALAGFLVDRVGARPVLFVALSCFVLAALSAAMAHGYTGLMLAAALAGLGNSPFHPVDFTILNKRVSQPRLGHAFSVHGISGNLGWAAAPLFLGGIAAATGSWRLAAGCAAGWALLVIGVVWWMRAAIDDRQGAWGHPAAGSAVTKAASAAAPEVTPKAAAARMGSSAVEHPMAFLKLPSVWLCFSFFFWSTCALSAIQSFAGPALHSLFALPLSVTSLVVTGYMLCGAGGMVVGGFLASRAERLERIIGVCLLVSAVMLSLVGAGLLPGLLAAIVTAMAGFGTGLAGPSRDMLIRRAAPPGATGRVYGTVYSGLDIGFAVAAPLFGALLDHGQPSAVFYGSALTLVIGVASASLIGQGVAQRRSAAVGAAA
jgi:MFS family permease